MGRPRIGTREGHFYVSPRVRLLPGDVEIATTLTEGLTPTQRVTFFRAAISHGLRVMELQDEASRDGYLAGDHDDDGTMDPVTTEGRELQRVMREPCECCCSLSWQQEHTPGTHPGCHYVRRNES
jgi:hypothetical protein